MQLLNRIKSIYFNFRYLPFKQAVYLPIWITTNFKVLKLKRGQIVLDFPYRKTFFLGDCGSVGLQEMNGGIYMEDGAKLIMNAMCVIGQGTTIRSTGSNPAMSKAQGININFAKVVALALSNAVVAFSGSLFSQYQGFADVNMGRGAIVIGLAAVIIGEVIGEAIFRKHINFIIRLIFVIVGGILYYIAMGIVLWLKMPTDDTKLFTAIIVAIFLAVPNIRSKAANSFKKVAKQNSKTQKTEG